LEAFLLSGAKNNVKLVLAGELDKSTMALVKEKNLENSVVFTGLLPEEKMPSYYRGAEALVFPSLYEGFGLPVLEAMINAKIVEFAFYSLAILPCWM